MATGAGDEPQDQNSEIVEEAGTGENQQNSAAGATQGGTQRNNGADVTILRKHLEEKIEKKEEQILKPEAGVFQLANYYFVFQGVMLTAIIKGSSGGLKCRYFWLPFSLSLIGGVLNFGSLLIIGEKYVQSLNQLDKKNLMLYKLLDPGRFKRMSETHKKREERRRLRTRMGQSLFLLFALLNLVATWIIPCLN